MTWPSPLLPDAVEHDCAVCGKHTVCILVFVDHDETTGRPTGPFRLYCLRCQRRDGDPFSVFTNAVVAPPPNCR